MRYTVAVRNKYQALDEKDDKDEGNDTEREENERLYGEVVEEVVGKKKQRTPAFAQQDGV